MQVEPLKLSDFESEEDFLKAMIERSCNPEQVEYYKDEQDFDRIKRLMKEAKELAQLASENDLCFWTYAHYDGKAFVGVSWGTWYSQINMETDGDDWVEKPYTAEDVQKMEKSFMQVEPDRLEETCCIVDQGDTYDEYEEYIEHHWWELSCGHEVLTNSIEEEPKYCPECGYKVISLEDFTGKMKDAINAQKHVIRTESIAITEQASHIKCVADRETITCYEFKAYCSKCGLNQSNAYGSEFEALKNLCVMSRGMGCK